jgi:hypothetical protein
MAAIQGFHAFCMSTTSRISGFFMRFARVQQLIVQDVGNHDILADPTLCPAILPLFSGTASPPIFPPDNCSVNFSTSRLLHQVPGYHFIKMPTTRVFFLGIV